METTNKKTAYSILELAIVSSGVTIEQTFKNSVDLAQKTEEMGYKRFWLAEHHNMIHVASVATSVLIGHIAGNTKSIRVGSGGIMLPNHSPLIVAEQFGTLGRLYPNRIDLGLGRAPGTDQITAHAIRSDRMQSVHNFPGEIKQIQKYFSNENEWSQVRAVVAEGVNVPLYILGSSLDSAHLAAKMGLPYAFASHFATGLLQEALDIYRKEFQPSEWLDKPYTIAGVNVIAANTDDEAERNFTSLIRMFLGILTGKREALQPPMEMTDELMMIQHNPAVREMLKYSFVGRKEAVAKQLDKFLLEIGVDELMVVSNMHAHKDRVVSYQILSEIINERNSQ
ncbi:LLM class flavin-dependent oxidoreductase [Flavobacterium lindanitolerans]|uniref:Luciferase-like monooxygenase n=1 Tax=Flavobacterium lindanitolerans TaxID=428988 RepID=A0A497UHR0_9FLAO|nr:LLM class flavin-dependent oxidoreductase [Flavobacterium lindanitolerans]PKW20941.1 luciferase family oxidoreductase group 1 [Flavobacterium lindanitolerans]RLJ30420.1 luciferase family oxidoreductase group 1 [Flavobacterium lindanitolerans]